MITFLKLGGSLITDKSSPETAATETIKRVANEIENALSARPEIRLVIGHGSGSFGHVAASKYGTREGVVGREQWRGFAEVGVIAARLNTLVLEELHQAGVPVFRMQPSASMICINGRLSSAALEPVRRALDAQLVPIVYGDVAFDRERGGTIVSTEEIFAYLAEQLHPDKMILAGNYPGVLDNEGNIIPEITAATIHRFRDSLGASGHADVTGGMRSKVDIMLALCNTLPSLTVQILSGQEPGNIYRALLHDRQVTGTLITNN